MTSLGPNNLPPNIKALIEEAKRVKAENDADGTWVSSEELRARLAIYQMRWEERHTARLIGQEVTW